MIRRIAHCRGCAHPLPRPFLDLGQMPLVDRLPAADELATPDPTYPLRVAFCAECGLAQLLETPPPEVLFPADYPYYSSYSSDYLAHAASFAEHSRRAFGLGADSLVVEIASNDGYLLRHYRALGIPTLGIDPAPGPAAVAQSAGIETLVTFFSPALAERLAAAGRLADLIVANNLLAHVPDPNVMLAAMRRLLKPTGVISLEVPSARELIQLGAFDTIYHEHHSYFSVIALSGLLRRNGLTIVDVERLEVHGGSLRVTARHAPAPATPAVARMLAEEQAAGLGDPVYYAGFAARVEDLTRTLAGLLARLRRQGARLAAYGAAAKGVVLLNRLGVGTDTLDYVVDRNPHKHGRWLPGVRIPVRPVETLLDERPDYVLLLAWNWEAEILAQQHQYLSQGGRFIVPIPWPRIVPET